LGVIVCVLVGMQYTPSLPGIKRHVWQRMPSGSVTKVVVTYKKVMRQQVLCNVLWLTA